MKKYKAIFFDWDGTAVESRKAPVSDVVGPMKELLKQGVKLAIISGTTIENIASGRLHDYFEPEQLKNLFMGLGRGAFNYTFTPEGEPYVFEHMVPDKQTLLTVHNICFEIHKELLEAYNFPTDIVFTRPNYCKIDLMVENNRGEQLFFQENELDILKKNLEAHGYESGLQGLIHMAERISKRYGQNISATTDAKYLEVGMSSKSDNVNTILDLYSKKFGIDANECSFWGDEYIGLDDNLYGSDSYMITPYSKDGDFFDVSFANGKRPDNVTILKGGVNEFIGFLKKQAEL